MSNSIEPGHIPGQNPDTPERLPGHTGRPEGTSYGPVIIYGFIACAIIVTFFVVFSASSWAADSSTPVSDAMQWIAYFGGAVLLGLAILYGIMRSRFSGAGQATDRATRRIYDEAERDRRRQEKEAQNSSNPIDVVERKTDTTG